MALQSFSHLGICVADLEVASRFWSDVLGFRELFTLDVGDQLAATMEREGGFTSRMLARDDVRIELLWWHDGQAAGDGRRRPMDHRGITHLCFRVDDAMELMEIAERSGGAAWPSTRTTIPGMGVAGAALDALYLTCPDGVRVECIAGTPDLATMGVRPANDRHA